MFLMGSFSLRFLYQFYIQKLICFAQPLWGHFCWLWLALVGSVVAFACFGDLKICFLDGFVFVAFSIPNLYSKVNIFCPTPVGTLLLALADSGWLWMALADSCWLWISSWLLLFLFVVIRSTCFVYLDVVAAVNIFIVAAVFKILGPST